MYVHPVLEPGESRFPGAGEPGRAVGFFFPAAWFLLKRRNRLKELLSSSARRCPVVRGSRLPCGRPPWRGGRGSEQHPAPARHGGNSGHRRRSPLPGSYSRPVSPFGGGGGRTDQELKLANCEQSRPEIWGQPRTRVVFRGLEVVCAIKGAGNETELGNSPRPTRARPDPGPRGGQARTFPGPCRGSPRGPPWSWPEGHQGFVTDSPQAPACCRPPSLGGSVTVTGCGPITAL